MRHSTRTFLRWVIPSASLVFACLSIAPAALAEVSETVSRSFDLGSGDRVEIENLAGSVRVSGGSGQATLEATIHAESREILDLLDLEID